MVSRKWRNISKRLQIFNANLFFLKNWEKIVIVALGIIGIGSVQIYLNVSGMIPKDIQMVISPVYIVFYFTWIKTSQYFLWGKYFVNQNDKVYIKKKFMSHVSEFGSSRNLEEIKKPNEPDYNINFVYHRILDKCEHCGYDGDMGFENRACPVCTHVHGNRLVEDGQPCDNHTACYAHKRTPCEGCGRTNMKGEVWIIDNEKV